MFAGQSLLNQMVNFSHFVIFSCSLFSFNAKLTSYFLIILRTLQRLLNVPVSYKLRAVWEFGSHCFRPLDFALWPKGRRAGAAPCTRPAPCHGGGAALRARPPSAPSGVWLTCRVCVLASRTPAALGLTIGIAMSILKKWEVPFTCLSEDFENV